MKQEKTTIEKVEDWLYWSCIFAFGYGLILLIIAARLGQ